MQHASRPEILFKRFGKTLALNGVGCEADHGTLSGLPGPNSAHNTTAVRILSSHIPPDAGPAADGGFGITRSGHSSRGLIGPTGRGAAADGEPTGAWNLLRHGRLSA